MLSTTTLLVLHFVIKIFSRKNLYTHIREKHGNETLRQCRGLEKATLKYEKLCYDLRFLLVCKKERLVPTFAKPKLSITVNDKIRKDVALLLIKAEIKNKHRLKNQLRQEIKRHNENIRRSTSFLLFHALRYKIRSAVSSRAIKWSSTHQNKLSKLQDEVKTKITTKTKKVLPNIIHNFSSYTLSDKEIEVLSYSLDHYIPDREHGKRTQVEFERFYQQIIPHTMHLAADEKTALKTKFLETYNKYTKVKIPSEEKKILENLYGNNDITVLRQDKGRGVVVMNKCDYVNKSKNFFDGTEFEELNSDPTKSFQTRVQRTLLKMKKKFTVTEYKRIYPSSSRPGLFFGLAKVHKLKNGCTNVNELPLRPVISNIGTATYEISKYLASLLQPIAKSEFTIDSTKDFVQKIKSKKIQQDFEMISFDVASLFTSVPLDFTIELILKKVYNEKLITTKLKREELKTLLELCTKEMHFSFDGNIYRQVNGVTMGSPLGPVIANIFMVELEKKVIPTINDKVSLWYRYVDDTFTFVKRGEVDSVLRILDNFHDNIRFTFEKQTNDSIAFLDVKVIRKADGSFDTDIHRKKTDTNVYLNWKSFAPKAWKVGTLKGLIRRAFIICSTEEYKRKEVSFLKNVFKQNGFPSRVINQVVNEVKNKMSSVIDLDTNTSQNSSHVTPTVPLVVDQKTKEDPYTPYICLPYKGISGEKIVRGFKTILTNVLPKEIKPRIIFKGKKLSNCFRVKDRVPIEHATNLIYAFKPTHDSRKSTEYIGETNVRFETRAYEHIHTDKASSVYKYKVENNLDICESDFEILDKGFSKSLDRKLAEALYIKEMDPTLNRQKKSFTLHLFN